MSNECLNSLTQILANPDVLSDLNLILREWSKAKYRNSGLAFAREDDVDGNNREDLFIFQDSIPRL